MRDHEGVVNTAVTLAIATGIMLAKDTSLLAENCGEIDLSKKWAQRIISRMRFVKHKASTGAKVDTELKELQGQYLSDIQLQWRLQI